MAAFDILSFDGTTLSSGDIEAWLDQRDPYVVAASLDVRTRQGTTPIVAGYALEGAQRIVRVAKRAGSVATDDSFRRQVEDLFDPSGNDAARNLLFTAGDGTTTLRLPSYVVRREWLPHGVDQYIIEMFAADAGSVADALTTSGVNPVSVTNAGTTDALPSIALTTGTHVQRRKAVLTTSAGQRGRAGVPVRITIPTAMTGATASNTLALINGSPVPTYFVSTTVVWVVTDVPGDGGSITVEIIWGSGIVNPLGHLLANTGDFDWLSSTNTAWRVARYTPSDNPIRAGEWRPAVMGRNALSGSSFELDDSVTTSVTFRRYTGAQGRNDADCMVMSIPQTTGTTIINLTRTTTGLDANSRAFLRTRAQGTNIWTDAWTTSANATVSTSITIPTNTVEIAVGVEYINAAAATNPTLQVSGATAEIAVDAVYALDAIGAAENLDYYDGTIVIGDDTITFRQVYVKDGTLTLNAVDGSAASSTGEAHYGAIRGSDPSALARLKPGANAVSKTLDAGASFTISHRAAYS